MSKSLRVGACQTPEIIGNVEEAINCILAFARDSTADQPDILLFPECFLQGYIAEKDHVGQYALGASSDQFKAVLKRLSKLSPLLIFGFIEAKDGKYYNSAAVIQQGDLLGIYRKANLTAGESIFEAGNEFPIFTLNNIKFGINICYDTQFADAAANVAKQGAQLLLVPAQNMMRRENAEKWKHLHNQIRAQRVKETKMWLISSDVTGERGKTRIAYGPTSAMNPDAEVVAQVPLMLEGMIIVEVRV